MNLFHRNPGPLPETDLALAQALADVATIGILQEQAIHRGEVLNAQLQTALKAWWSSSRPRECSPSNSRWGWTDTGIGPRPFP